MKSLISLFVALVVVLVVGGPAGGVDTKPTEKLGQAKDLPSAVEMTRARYSGYILLLDDADKTIAVWCQLAVGNGGRNRYQLEMLRRDMLRIKFDLNMATQDFEKYDDPVRHALAYKAELVSAWRQQIDDMLSKDAERRERNDRWIEKGRDKAP